MITEVLQFKDSLMRIIGNCSVDGTARYYARLVNNGVGDSDRSNCATITSAAALKNRRRNKKRLSLRLTLMSMCSVSLCAAVLSCFHLKPFREIRGHSLAVNYINIPIVNLKLSIFNILNILTPALGLYGAYAESLEGLNLFKGLLYMDFMTELGSFTYLFTAARSLLGHKETLLSTGTSTIASPSYFHLFSSIWTSHIAFMATAPFYIVAKQLHFKSTAMQYETELEDRKYRRIIRRRERQD